jgi:hypothetical protein
MIGNSASSSLWLSCCWWSECHVTTIRQAIWGMPMLSLFSTKGPDSTYYQRLTEWFYKPYSKMLQDHPRMAETQPFECVTEFASHCKRPEEIIWSIKVKDINFSYHVEKVFAVDIPVLQHGNDGLIYTCVSTPYTPGTDKNMWVLNLIWRHWRSDSNED